MSLKPVYKRENTQNFRYIACTQCFTGLRTAVMSKHTTRAKQQWMHEWTEARAELLGGRKGAEAAARILRSLIQWSLAVFTQPLRHLAFVRRICYMHEQKRSKSSSSIARSPSHLHMRGWTEFARSRHSERIACGVIFLLCVISAFLHICVSTEAIWQHPPL